ATNFTPILINTEATPPRMFRGGEDKWHLTYDLLLTNYTRGASKIKELQILGRKGDGEFRVLKTLSGVELTKAMMQPDLKAKPGGLTPGQIAVVWVNLDFDNQDSVPTELTHRIVFNSISPTHEAKTYDYKAAPLN